MPPWPSSLSRRNLWFRVVPISITVGLPSPLGPAVSGARGLLEGLGSTLRSGPLCSGSLRAYLMLRYEGDIHNEPVRRLLLSSHLVGSEGVVFRDRTKPSRI